MNRWGICLCVLMILMAGSLVASSSVYAGFGQESEFGSDSLNGGLSSQTEGSRYFIHDTFVKFVLVLVFTGIAVIFLLTKRSLRKLLLIVSLAVLGFVVGGFLCPFMSVQNVFFRYQTGFLLLFLVPTILALILGRVYCGFVCPFGAIQELIHIPTYRFTIPHRFLTILQKIKYLVLGYLVVRFLVTNVPILVGHTPFNALFSFGGTVPALVLTAITASLSVIVFRPFCQVACPLGAWLGICSLLSRWSMVPAACKQCNLCAPLCGVQGISKGKIQKMECIVCGRCADCCPLTRKKERMKNTAEKSQAA